MDLILPAKLAAATAAALAPVLITWKGHSSERRQRIHMLDGFLGRLQTAKVGMSPWRYPVVQGALDASPVRVDLIPDTLVLRTLPTLWLQARWLKPHVGRLRVTVEPSGTEYMADDLGLTTRFAPPSGWSRTTEVCGSGSGSLLLLHELQRVDLAAFPSLKLIELTERELKVTMRCARGDRTTYRVLRSAKFAPDAVTPQLIDETLTLLRTVEETLSERPTPYD